MPKAKREGLSCKRVRLTLQEIEGRVKTALNGESTLVWSEGCGTSREVARKVPK